MCGICGVFSFNSDRPVTEEILKRMCNILKHRGPDDEGYFFGGNKQNGKHMVGLGIRRLSIIDLETGHQPIHNEDKTIWLTQNGEIYNYRELRNELESKGHKFYTNSDTEIIVHLYEDYGKNCVKYLRGMFAISIWDERKKNLILIRDRIGKKPLYYSITDGTLIFGSEIKSILEYPDIPRKINLNAIHLFLTYQYIPSPQTIFQNIYRLPPASILTCDFQGKINIERYWNLDFTYKTKLTFNESCIKIREILTESTKLRLISDVPLGAFLSGGHDSSIIVGLMSELSTKPVKTFSIGFEEQDFSELKYARIIANQFHTEHYEFIVKPKFIEILPKIIWFYDQPFADSSALPTYYVSNITREHVKVALNGDGGDENFAGYLRYKAMKGSLYCSFLFQILGKKFTLYLSSLLPHIETSKSKNIFRYLYRLTSALPYPAAKRHVLWHRFFTNELKSQIYSNEFLQQVGNNDAYDYLIDVFNRAPAYNIMDKTFYTDFMTYLPECLLVKMDVASMANSLEARSPFLDHKLIEFTASINPSWKLHGLTTKYILKQTFKNMLPHKILHRGKQGFGIPLGKWFKNDWRNYFYDTVLSTSAIQRGYFTKKGLEKLFNEHIKGYNDHGYCMYALLVLELWHRIFIDRREGY